jgi:hypothetical protein
VWRDYRGELTLTHNQRWGGGVWGWGLGVWGGIPCIYHMHRVTSHNTLNQWGRIFTLLKFKPAITNTQKLISFVVKDFTNLHVVDNVALQFGHLCTPSLGRPILQMTPINTQWCSTHEPTNLITPSHMHQSV